MRPFIVWRETRTSGEVLPFQLETFKTRPKPIATSTIETKRVYLDEMPKGAKIEDWWPNANLEGDHETDGRCWFGSWNKDGTFVYRKSMAERYRVDVSRVPPADVRVVKEAVTF